MLCLGSKQSTGGCSVTVDQLPGGRASVCELDGDCGRDFKLCRQTVFWDERQNHQPGQSQSTMISSMRFWLIKNCILINVSHVLQTFSSFQLLLEDVLSHRSVLDVISMKGSNMAEHYVTQLEIQDLQERYNIVKNKAQVKFIPH